MKSGALRFLRLAKQYRDNQPCPHILLKDFLEPEVALTMAEEFPRPDSAAWTQYKHPNENKLGMPSRELFPPTIAAVTEELNSPEFTAWVSQLTGIPNLISDPMLEGGGLHQSGPGGYLNVHTDFSMHHFHTQLAPARESDSVSEPELAARSGAERSNCGNAEMKRCAAKYPPMVNHALIFTTDERSLHGFPDPLTCPAGQSRKSLALYYYTVEPGKKVTRALHRLFRSSARWLGKVGDDLARQKSRGSLLAGQGAVRILRRVCQQGAGIFVEEEVAREGSNAGFAQL